MSGGSSNQSAGRSHSLNLTAAGLTLLGVLLSIGATVAFGLSGAWWVRLLAGLGTVAVLLTVVKLGTSHGRGPVARAANWVIGAGDEEPRG